MNNQITFGQNTAGDPNSQSITQDLNLENEFKVINAVDPTNSQDYVTLSYGNSHYSGSGSSMPATADLNYISTTNQTLGTIDMQGFQIHDVGSGGTLASGNTNAANIDDVFNAISGVTINESLAQIASSNPSVSSITASSQQITNLASSGATSTNATNYSDLTSYAMPVGETLNNIALTNPNTGAISMNNFQLQHLGSAASVSTNAVNYNDMVTYAAPASQSLAQIASANPSASSITASSQQITNLASGGAATALNTNAANMADIFNNMGGGGSATQIQSTDTTTTVAAAALGNINVTALAENITSSTNRFTVTPPTNYNITGSDYQLQVDQGAGITLQPVGGAYSLVVSTTGGASDVNINGTQLSMNNNKITGLANATASTDAVAFGQLGSAVKLSSIQFPTTGTATESISLASNSCQQKVDSLTSISTNITTTSSTNDTLQQIYGISAVANPNKYLGLAYTQYKVGCNDADKPFLSMTDTGVSGTGQVNLFANTNNGINISQNEFYFTTTNSSDTILNSFRASTVDYHLSQVSKTGGVVNSVITSALTNGAASSNYTNMKIGVNVGNTNPVYFQFNNSGPTTYNSNSGGSLLSYDSDYSGSFSGNNIVTATYVQNQVGTPVGTVIMHVASQSTGLTGYLACNGGTFSSSTYPLLYAALGNSTTLPNFNNGLWAQGTTGSTLQSQAGTTVAAHTHTIPSLSGTYSGNTGTGTSGSMNALANNIYLSGSQAQGAGSVQVVNEVATGTLNSSNHNHSIPSLTCSGTVTTTSSTTGSTGSANTVPSQTICYYIKHDP